LGVPNNVPRNHHYVCEFLLKNFADDNGTLWIYDAELGRYRDGNTRSAGFERDLYALTLKDRGRDFGFLERALEREIDTPGAAAVRKLSRREKCDGPEWMNFLGFVAAQMVRTPDYFDRLKAIQAPLMQESFERMARSEPKFRDGVRKSMIEKGANSEKVERHLHAAATGRYRAQPSPDWIVASAVQLIPFIRLASLIFRRNRYSSRRAKPQFHRWAHRLRHAERPPRRRQSQFLNTERRFRSAEGPFRGAEELFRYTLLQFRAAKSQCHRPERQMHGGEKLLCRSKLD
jgi:hypothetical protein